MILAYNFLFKDKSLTLPSAASLFNAVSVSLINRLPVALYPSTNNYANKNQWSNNRKSLARQLKPGTFLKVPVGHTRTFGKVPWTAIKRMMNLSVGK